MILVFLLAAWAGPALAQPPQLDSTRNNYLLPEGMETVPLGTLGRVERRGSGPVPMILVPGHGYGGDVFRTFMEANEERYTMYAVTLPGFGGTAPPPLPPESSSYMDQVWTRAAEEAVVRLIEREGLDRPVVVGHFITGGQIAMRLALDHPDRVRGAVVLAGEARRNVGSDDPAIRRQWVDENLRKRWFKWVTPEVWVFNNWKAPIMARDAALAETLKDEGNSPPLRVLIQYLAEFFASDVPAELGRLERPVLALTPGFDAELLADPDLSYAQTFFIDSWDGLDAHEGVTVRSIEGARAFLWEDEPDATYRAIHTFVEGLDGVRDRGDGRQQRLEDLGHRVIPVRSVDPADDDFSDLAALAESIGEARVVQLGESSHGAGSTFAAKARLVKFLHAELGFDLLLWESGMYDLRTVNDSLAAGADPATAARLGVFTIWSGTREVLPLFEYAQDSHAWPRPLEMAGFDVQFSGAGAADRFALDLLRFSREAGSVGVRGRAEDLVQQMMDAYARFRAAWTARSRYVADLRRAGIGEAITDSVRAWDETRREGFAPRPPDLDRFLAASDALLDLLRTERSEFVRPHGEREVAFVERTVINLRELGTTEYERNAAGHPTEGAEALALGNRGWNRRDAGMAENLLWLARERYPDRKIIVWAHNGHIMNAYYEADWSALSHEPTDGGMKPMGAYLAEEMGDDLYTVAFTAFAGEHAMVTTGQRQDIEEAPPESLEALMHDLGHDQAFLDFRALPPGHWLRRPATMAIRGYMPETMDDWTRVVDGVFFIDRMTPATLIEGSGSSRR